MADCSGEPRRRNLDPRALQKRFALIIYVDCGDFADWAALLDHWQTSLKAIAAEIKAGEASVLVNKESDLVYCDVLPLLRLAERSVQFERAQAAMTEASA